MLNRIASGFAALAEAPIGLPVRAIAGDWWETLVRVTFALFVGGLLHS
jgi:hypothetical protein